MATVESMTLERQLAIEASSVVSGAINGSGHLILTKHDGSTIDAGNALVAVPADQVISYLNPTGYSEATPATSYPDGISIMWMSNTETSADWPTFSGLYGVLQTTNFSVAHSSAGSDGDTIQIWRRQHGSGITPEMWMRAGNSAAGWSNWKRLALADEVATVSSGLATNTANIASLTTTVSGHTTTLSNIINGIELAGGVNLNSITTPGLYTQTADSEAASGSNYPEALSGVLEVFAMGANFVTQRYIPYGNNSDRFYLRNYYVSTGWSTWKKYEASTGDTGWVNMTLNGGFTAGGSGAYIPRARVKNNVVRLDGSVVGNYGTYGSFVDCFTLPAGYRPTPSTRPLQFGASGPTTVHMSINVLSNGIVQVYASAATTALISFSNVNFLQG